MIWNTCKRAAELLLTPNSLRDRLCWRSKPRNSGVGYTGSVEGNSGPNPEFWGSKLQQGLSRRLLGVRRSSAARLQVFHIISFDSCTRETRGIIQKKVLQKFRYFYTKWHFSYTNSWRPLYINNISRRVYPLKQSLYASATAKTPKFRWNPLWPGLWDAWCSDSEFLRVHDKNRGYEPSDRLRRRGTRDIIKF